jgi:FAD/FMN-containing dehydrogenase
VGGHVLHGGYGYASHTWGLALDMLLEAQVVLADGSVVIASETENTDLFWALRGAGSSFGIVTRYKFKTYPAVDQLVNWEYAYNWTKPEARKALDVIQAYAASKDYPAEMNARFFITATGVKFWGVYQGTRASFDPVFNAIIAKLPGTPIATSIVETGWIDSIKKWAFMDITMPVDYVIHENFFSKSMMTKTISAAGLDKFTDYWYTTANTITRVSYATT